MSPVPQAIAPVIATDVQCTGCVGTSDIAGSAVTSGKIKDGEVKASDIATDAVGAAELQGVTKLLFGQCVLTQSEYTTTVSAGGILTVVCSIKGVEGGDSVTATLNHSNICFHVTNTDNFIDAVHVTLQNQCGSPAYAGYGSGIGLIVFDK